MSSALWHFFWDENDWGDGGEPEPPAPAPAPQDPGSGGGYKSKEDYYPANEDYWDARAAYLRSLQQEMALDLPPAAIEPAPTPKSPASPKTAQFGDWKQLPRLQREYQPAVARVTAATNMQELRDRAHRLRELTHAIRNAEAAKLAYDRQIRVTKRKQQIAHAKKSLASLMVLQALVNLIRPH